jgi:MFS family permease
MVTDLIPEENRTEAFSLTRTSSNIGFAVGPAVGGFIAVSSFKISLYIGAITMAIIFLITTFFLKETLPKYTGLAKDRKISMGYGAILKDKTFLVFLSGDTLVKMGMIMMFSLLAVYAKENFGVPESQYGFIMTVNAIMAATLQYPATRITKRYPPTMMLAVGALFYAAGLGSVALGSQFFHFVISMVIMTVGELILMPTAMTLVAAISPIEMRGRYMSLYSMTMGAAKGLGPMIGGVLNDQIAPVAIWFGAMVMALLSVGVFLLLFRFLKNHEWQRVMPNP